MKKTALTLAALAMLTLTAACNTVAGVGKDVQGAGEVVEETAKDVKEEITK